MSTRAGSTTARRPLGLKAAAAVAEATEFTRSMQTIALEGPLSEAAVAFVAVDLSAEVRTAEPTGGASSLPTGGTSSLPADGTSSMSAGGTSSLPVGGTSSLVKSNSSRLAPVSTALKQLVRSGGWLYVHCEQ